MLVYGPYNMDLVKVYKFFKNTKYDWTWPE